MTKSQCGATSHCGFLFAVWFLFVAWFLFAARFLFGVVSYHSGRQYTGTSSKNVVIVTVATKNLRQGYSRQLDTLQSYARKHGYSFFEYTPGNKKEAYWDKLTALSLAPRHDYYVFFDADTAILQPSIRAELLFRPSDSVVFAGSPMLSSSHFVALRHDDISKAFLTAWRRGRATNMGCHYDQGPFIYAMVGTLQRFMYGTKHEESRIGLEKCANILHKTTGRCSAFQSCVGNWSKKWFCPFTDGCCRDVPRKGSWLVRRRARRVPFRWQCDLNFTLSWQGNRKSIYEGEKVCSSFSVHPVKKWDKQLKC